MTDNDARLEAQIQKLIGEVDTLKKLIPASKLNLIQLFSQGIDSVSINRSVDVMKTDKALGDGSEQIQILDANGGERSVRLPLEANTNRMMIILNAST